MSAIPTIEISAPRGLVPLNLHELWEYRELVYFLLARDIKGRYRQMAFGPLWMVLSPVLNTVVFTLIFGMLAKLPSEGIPYPLFNYSALLPWTFFSTCVFTAAGSLLNYRDLISKVYFPRLVIPVVGVFSALVDFVISFVILLGMGAYFGYYPTANIVFAPIFILLAAVTGLAVGLWFAAWIVHFRDVQALLQYIIRGWMYVTPVVYAASLIPEKWLPLYRANPMTTVIEGFRWAVLGVGDFSWHRVMVAFAWTIPLTVAGAYYFRRTERSIVDIA